MSRRSLVTVTVVALGVFGAAGWAVGAGGWPGEPSGCIVSGDCSCEAFTSGIVVQPINTVSSLVFVLTGIGLLRFGRSSIGVPFALLVVFVGVGSAAFHASVTEWGGWLDLVAVHALLIYVLSVDAAMWFSRSRRWVFASAGGVTAVMTPILWWIDNGWGKYSLAALVLAFIGLEWALRHRDTGRDAHRLRWAAALGIVGLGVQWLGRGGGPLCDPDSLLQVHAMWHAIAAAAAVLLYRYLFVESRYQVPGTRYD